MAATSVDSSGVAVATSKTDPQVPVSSALAPELQVMSPSAQVLSDPADVDRSIQMFQGCRFTGTRPFDGSGHMLERHLLCL